MLKIVFGSSHELWRINSQSLTELSDLFREKKSHKVYYSSIISFIGLLYNLWGISYSLKAQKDIAG